MSFCRPCVFIAAYGLFVGCGHAPPEPPRFHLAGKITFQGQPIPAGSIQLEPVDAVAKPELLGGYATIKNGMFDTRTAGRGHLGGKIKAVLNGYDGVVQGEWNQGLPLFSSLEILVELPTQDSTRDFQLPP